MPKTYQSTIVNAPADQIWSRIRDFHDFSWAPNVITRCERVGEKSGLEIGAKRVLNDAFHETLIELNEDNKRIRYTIDKGPSPISSNDVSNYIGNLHILPVTDSNTSFVEWSSSWESETDEAVEVCQNIYVALLKDLPQSYQ